SSSVFEASCFHLVLSVNYLEAFTSQRYVLSTGSTLYHRRSSACHCQLHTSETMSPCTSFDSDIQMCNELAQMEADRMPLTDSRVMTAFPSIAKLAMKVLANTTTKNDTGLHNTEALSSEKHGLTRRYELQF
uniref:Cyclin_C domain-containing protein n=1 Tax=Mesocestoides corti TaxID=53468 RepID=A0A5K3FDU1_MESCO